jgi:hypothetical protein
MFSQETLDRLVAVGLWAIREGVAHIDGLSEYENDPRFNFTPESGQFILNSKRKTRSAPRPESDPTCYTFDQFYEDYGYKRDKHTASQLWRKLSEKDRLAVKRALPMYKEDSLVKGEQAANGVFIPHRQLPSTFLNKRTWLSYEEERYVSKHPQRYAQYQKWCESKGFGTESVLNQRQFDHYIEKVIPKYGAQEAQVRFIDAHLDHDGNIYESFLNKI